MDTQALDAAVDDAHVSIAMTLTPKVNLSFHQNAVPFLHELRVVNGRDEPLRDLTVTVSSEPAFLTPRVWHLDEVAPGLTYHLDDLDVGLNGGLLATLTEAHAAHVTVVLTAQDEELARCEHPIELLARNQWGGIGHMPDLVAAFVQPNDPAVERLIKAAARILRDNGKSGNIDGYGQGSKHAWDIVSAIWSAMAGLGLDYALPPASFERSGQKVRGPSHVTEAGLATCLDTTLLFCAAIEQAGLNPLVVFTRGHAFAGAWLKDEQFSTVVVDDVTSLRKRVRLNEMVLFETTLITQCPAPKFGFAAERGARQVSEAEEDKFELAVDVRRARLHRVRPLSADGAVTAPVPDAAPEDIAPPPFDAAPDLPDEVIQRGEEPLPQSPKGRLDRWQRKLLDLSLRNGLLNFRAGKKAIVLQAPDPGRLEDLLADGKQLRLRPRPDLMDGADPRSRSVHERRMHEDVARGHALDALGRGEVLVDLPELELDGRLTELYRTARSTLQEGGANTLYVALGFLSWTRDAADDKRHKAPLVLLPVTLTRKSVRSGFLLALHDDEPRFNPTLIEMLRQDFKLTIPVAEGELPKDDSGLDIAGIWQAVGEAVKDIRGWEVTDDVVLGTFSFAKYLMWKDLVDRTEILKQNPVVRHLIDTPRDPYPSGSAFPEPRALDRTLAPAETFCPLPADSSQLSAVMAAAQGKDFVLVGPPGTGKSQTIANLIAQCLAERKTVLFVSEKIAALDVVYRRLRDVGLGDFCLELHSSKARKLDVLEQLRKAWTAKGTVDAEQWRKESERLRSLRDELNIYVEHLHRRHRNGLTPHQALGRVVAGRDHPTVAVSWPSVDAHDEDALQALRDLVARLAIDATEIDGLADGALALVDHAEWSPSWQHSLLAAARDVVPAAEDLEAAAAAFCNCSGLPDRPLDRRTREALAALAEMLPQAAGRDWRFVLAPDARTLAERLREGLGLLRRHGAAVQATSVPYGEAARTLDLDGLRATWLEAEATWFLPAWLRRRNVTAALRQAAQGRDPADVLVDLDRLIEIRNLERQLGDLDALGERTAGTWAGLKTSSGDVESALAFRQALTEALGGLADSADDVMAIKASLSRLLGDGNALLEPTGPVTAAGKAYAAALARYQQTVDGFAALAGGTPDGPSAPGMAPPSTVAAECRALVPLEPKLHAWCAWRKARTEAITAGLGPLVEALEQGMVSPAALSEVFETVYSRWWLDAVVDGDDVLQGFVSKEHERRIADFRALDDRFTALTRDMLRAGLCAELPAQEDVSRSSEWGILRREMEKKRRHIPLRELIRSLPTALGKLAPCQLMSPLSIAQYLAAETAPFDVVVFDEASQIPVWDAIGAIARGKQVVMVGDPKQLPPTSFFDRAESEADDDDPEVEGDLESILDECLGANLPTLDLSWHYRSRHESLIAFSNHRYYGGGLVTFPSPVTQDRAVSFHHVADGVYEKGGGRINQPEARALVADLVGRLEDPAFRAEGLTIGVVTFNGEQQRLIENLLDDARRKNPAIEPFFAEDALEPVFVKNLESVQGDERDVMYFSITYGPDRSGAVSMNFGPMNRDGGERRLNVAVTRARHELRVFSSLRPEQLDLSRTAARGVRDLKHFMEFAERGPRALAEAVFGSIGDFDSPFEKAVAAALARKGWQVHPQVGVSAFRIDLGVVDPDAPGRYLAGVECDGATYHRAATARDRDKLREQVLRGLGWDILRIWSTDWWHDPEGALEKVHGALEGLLAASRQRLAAERAAQEVEAIVEAVADEGVASDAPEPNVSVQDDETTPVVRSRRPADDLFRGEDLMVSTATYARRAEGDEPQRRDEDIVVFREADPLAVVPSPDARAFFEPSYDSVLETMIAHVVAVEGPIREAVLAKRIARVHGWARTGARIRDRVSEVARRRHPVTTEEIDAFFWPPGGDTASVRAFRRATEESHRSVDDIAMPELIALARAVRGTTADDEEALVRMAREAGLKQLRQAARERLEQAWRLSEPTP